ncbi:hypothetical protein Cci01nite_80930 [Catellatospora citrea]|uniref:Uncharacterized protein n=1 Tax=Catellatospora citrea TaxID=53366 RepID=A0A8J3KXG9_9ACTN|nr:hypothetical protein Cci01nite_80930 [Catellatospora citrea]
MAYGFRNPPTSGYIPVAASLDEPEDTSTPGNFAEPPCVCGHLILPKTVCISTLMFATIVAVAIISRTATVKRTFQRRRIQISIRPFDHPSDDITSVCGRRRERDRAWRIGAGPVGKPGIDGAFTNGTVPLASAIDHQYRPVDPRHCAEGSTVASTKDK